MTRYYIVYVYRCFNGSIKFGNNVFEIETISYDNLKKSMDEIKDRILSIHPADKIEVLSWQEV